MTDDWKTEAKPIRTYDVQSIARAATEQLSATPGKLDRLVANLLLNEPFALGYAMGFSEAASAHANAGSPCPKHQRDILNEMLGCDTVTASFVSFAATKHGNRSFEGGFDVGMHDLNAWHTSDGTRMPDGLAAYLQKDAKLR